MESIDIAIVGGGIVGLWTAYTLIQKQPALTIVIFEKEPFLGEHSTGRNSEVLHAGLYYDYGSLKHLLCLQGNILWRQFCNQKSLPFFDCGKFVVSNLTQKNKLDALFTKAEKNSVPGLRLMTRSEHEELRNHVNLDLGFYSPSSAVLDISGAVKLLAHLFEQAGGIILRSTELHIIERNNSGFTIRFGNEFMQANILINCAGHHAVSLRKQLNLHDYQNRWVKGTYLTLKKKLPLKNLIYPVPPDHGLGLGVHLTLDVAENQKFGPNTEDVDIIDYAVNQSAIDQMHPSIAELFPTITKDMLSLGYAGVRSKIVDYNQHLQKDFIIGDEKNHNIKNYYEFLGIESPGVTAAPALAEALSKII